MPVLVLLAACSGGSQADAEAATARVIDVLDGDSVVVKMDAGRVEVRLFGIDAPEHKQAYSDSARKGLEDLVNNRDVELLPVEKDRFGRTVAQLLRKSDRLNVNQEMLRRGHAWVYRQYNDDKAWIAIETEARDAGRGLWAGDDPVPPWNWRRENPRKR